MTKFDWGHASVAVRHAAAIPLALLATTAVSYLALATLPLSSDLKFIGGFTFVCLTQPAVMIFAYYTAHPRALAAGLAVLAAAILAWALL